MTPDELNRLEELERRATPGPWVMDHGGQLDIPHTPENREFIHYLRKHAPALIAAAWERDELKDKLATKEDLLQVCDQGHVWRTGYGKPGCPFCYENASLRERIKVAERGFEDVSRHCKLVCYAPNRAEDLVAIMGIAHAALARIRGGGG